MHLPARDKPWMYGLIPIRFLAESVEAGASIWQITGQETDIVLGVGNLRHAFRKDCVNVVCLDDDARGSAAWKQANRAIRAARAAGHVVLIVNTWQVRRGDKTDLNDILRQSGPEGPALLQQRISTSLYPEAPRRKRLKPADAIKQVRATATDFMALATRMASGEEGILSDVQVALRGDTGIGKSHIIRELLADAIRAIRKAGNDRLMPPTRRRCPASRGQWTRIARAKYSPFRSSKRRLMPVITTRGEPSRQVLIAFSSFCTMATEMPSAERASDKTSAISSSRSTIRTSISPLTPQMAGGCINFVPLSRTFGLANSDRSAGQQASAAAMSEVFADLRDHPLSGRHRLGRCRGLEQLGPAVLDLADCRPDRPPARRSLPRDG